MENFRSNESVSDFDFLDENLKVTIDFEYEAFQHLPVVSPDDRQMGRERFGVLLGAVKVAAPDRLHVRVRGVYQETKDEQNTYGTYIEGIENVLIDFASLQQEVEQILQKEPQYQTFSFLGDVHTHPNSVAYPSHQDLISVVEAYEAGDLDLAKPYIFGIGARQEDGRMDYEYFRIIRTDSESGYGFKVLD